MAYLETSDMFVLGLTWSKRRDKKSKAMIKKKNERDGLHSLIGTIPLGE